MNRSIDSLCRALPPFGSSKAGQRFGQLASSLIPSDPEASMPAGLYREVHFLDDLIDAEEYANEGCSEDDCLESTCTCSVEQALGGHSNSHSKDKGITILGIDPGFSTTGYGVLRKQGGQTHILDFGAFALSAHSTIPERIAAFHAFFSDKIIQWQIQTIALETPFLGKNAQNFLKLGYLRGILYLLAQQHTATLSEFAPREIKKAVAGSGAADKAQVARVIMQLFQGLQMPGKLDVTDALAIALCALWRETSYYSAQRTL